MPILAKEFGSIEVYIITFIVYGVFMLIGKISNKKQQKKEQQLEQARTLQLKKEGYPIEATSYGHVIRTGTLGTINEGKDVIDETTKARQYGRMIQTEQSVKLDPSKIEKDEPLYKDTERVKGLQWNNQSHDTPMEVNLAQKRERERLARLEEEKSTPKKLSDFYKQDE